MSVTTAVRCDGCGRLSVPSVPMLAGRARAAARQNELWAVSGLLGGDDYCPECWQRRKAELGILTG